MRRRRQIPRSDLGREGAGTGSGLWVGSGSRVRVRACVHARASSIKCRVSSLSSREGSKWNGVFSFHNERYFLVSAIWHRPLRCHSKMCRGSRAPTCQV